MNNLLKKIKDFFNDEAEKNGEVKGLTLSNSKHVLIVSAVAILALVVTLVLGVTQAYTVVDDSGYALNSSSKVKANLVKGENKTTRLEEVNSEDLIYSNSIGYYLGESKVGINKEFPLYMNNGTALRFLDDSNNLVSAKAEIYETFEGLYLSNGKTYNSSRVEVDLDEFILLSLKNGLYMNAQDAKFINLLGSRDIKINSIIYFSENAIRWYEQDQETLLYFEDKNTFDAAFQIGEHTYYYKDLLKALSILKEAEEEKEKEKDPQKKIDEAHEILIHSEAKYQENNNGTTGTGESREGEGGTGEGGEISGDSEGSQGSESQETGSGTGTGEGKGEKGTHEKTAPSKDPHEHEKGEGGTGQGGTGKTGEKTEGEGGNEDISDKKDGEAGESDPNNPGSAPKPTQYVEPVVKFTNIEPWSYAIFGNLNVYDPVATIDNGIKVYIYSSINGSGEKSVNEEGFNTYEANNGVGGGYNGGTLVTRMNFAVNGDISLTPLPPNTTLYIQLQYKYDEFHYETRIEKGKEITEKKKTVKTYKSPFIEVHTLSPKDEEAGIIVNWEDVFANDTNALSILGLSLKNTTDYDPEAEFSIENEKKNLAQYVNKIELVFTKTSGFEPSITGKIPTTVLQQALNGMDAGVVLPAPAARTLDSDSEYIYTAKAFDKWNNEISVIFGPDIESAIPLDDLVRTIYTKKATPTAKFEISSNKAQELILKVTVTDKDNAIKLDEGGNIGHINVTDYLNNATELIGDIDGVNMKVPSGDPIPLKAKSFGIDHTATYTIKITNLFSAQTYFFEMLGMYDPQPTLKADDPINRLNVYEVKYFTKSVYTAPMEDATLILSTKVQKDEDDKDIIGAHYVNMEYTVSKESSPSALYNTEIIQLALTLDKETIFDFELNKDLVNNTLNSSKFVSEYNGFEFIKKTNTSPGVYLVYTEYGEEHKAEVKDKYWENLFPKYDSEAVSELNDAIFKIVISTPSYTESGKDLNYLKSYTSYSLKVNSFITQVSSGIKKNYGIKTKMSLSRITTLREPAKVIWSDLYVGSGKVVFTDLKVYDKDGAVRNNGNVTVRLLKGESALFTEKIVATNDMNATGYDIEIPGLKKGSVYTLEVIADAYSEEVAGGTISSFPLYRNNKITGSGSLTSTLSLSDLAIMLTEESSVKIQWVQPGYTYDEFYKSFTIPSALTGEYISKAIEQSLDAYTGEDKRNATYEDDEIVFDNRWYYDSSIKCYRTEYLELPEEAKFLRFEYLCDEDANKYIYFYDQNGDEIPQILNTVDVRNTRMMVAVPEGAVYVQLALYNPIVDEVTGLTYLEQAGLTLEFYKESDGIDYFEPEYFEEGKEYQTSGSLKTNSKMATLRIPVVPGQIYLCDAKCEISIYSNTMSYMGSTNKKVYNTPIEVPKNGGYLVINYDIPDGGTMDYSYHLWLASNSSDNLSNKKYEAILKLDIFDSLEYVMKDNLGYVNMIVEVSDTIENPTYDEDKSLSSIIEITEENFVEEYTYLKYIPLENLPAGSKFKISLLADIRGEEVVINEIEFSTDTSYILIHNNRELDYLTYYPFGNFLVVNDFEHFINAQKNETDIVKFYGTIDFQGHTITRRDSSAGMLFQYNYGTIKNLVYSIPEGQNMDSSVIYENRGTIDGIILETNGDVSFSGSGAITNNNYGELKNFIVKLNGYSLITSGGYGIVCSSNLGNIKDGYLYSAPGYGIVFRGYEVDDDQKASTITPSALVATHTRGVISNIYVLSDVWYSDYLEGRYYVKNLGTMVASTINSDIRDIYWVGEEFVEYLKNVDGANEYVKSRIDTYKNDLIIKNTYRKANVENIWHVFRTSEYSYSNINPLAKQTYWAQLRDTYWQEDILGEAFNGKGSTIIDNIGMGYYPRLSLTDEMESHQEYIKLPITDISMTPIILSDSWTNSKDHDNDSGLITLSFFNPNRATITSITIQNLGIFTIEGTDIALSDGSVITTDLIEEQGYDGGVWKVTLNASVTESEGDGYLSSYTISSFQYLGAQSATVSGYKTTGFEFWKLIDHAYGQSAKYKHGAWSDIDAHKNWNYKIVEDLDFTGVSETDIRIFEGTSTASEGSFTGKIDGLDYDSDNNAYLHTLSNIDMSSGVSIPAVISTLGAGGVVKNIIVQNMNIKSNSTPSIEYAGFIGNASCTDASSLGYIDNVHIVASSVTAFGNVGLLAGSATGTTISNCSAADYTLEGDDDPTPLIVTDISNTYPSYYGGLVGYGNETTILNCYVRNLEMSLNRGKNILGAGAIAGNLTGAIAEISNCYTTGSISVTGENIGGIVGFVEEASYLHIDNCWSNVLLDVKGTHVGGVAGRLSYEVNNNIALGSIFVTDESYSHRITGTLPSTGELHRTYAYEAQYVTGKDENNPDGAFRLISKEQLRLRSTWKDLVSIGDYFDVNCVSGVTRTYNGKQATYYLFPKLYSTDGKTYVWGQTGNGKELSDGDISLPGVFGEHTFEVDQALYSTPNGESDYMVVFKVHHPGITYDEFTDPKTSITTPGFKQMIETGQVSITIPGLGLPRYKGNFTSNDILVTGSILDANSNVVMSISLDDGTLGDDQATIVTVHAASVYSFYSLYRLEVKYTDFNKSKIDLLSDVQFLDEFGTPVEQWIEIKDWYDWCYYIVGRDSTNNYRLISTIDPDYEPHGRTLEKVRITGKVDMSQMADVYSGKYGDIYADFINLQFDILEGADEECGFYGNGLTGDDATRFVYNTTTNGDAWIDYIKTEIRRLTFSDVYVNLNNSKQTTASALSGLILKAQLVNNINLYNIEIETNVYTSQSSGFFGRVMSNISNVNMDNVSIRRADTTKSNTSKSYAGTLAGTVYDSVNYVNANNIRVDMEYTQYVGGLVGIISNDNNQFFNAYNDGCMLTNFDVFGHIAAGVFGYTKVGINNFTVDGVNVKAFDRASGFIDTATYKYTKNHTVKNISVSNGSIESIASHGAGMFYNIGGYTLPSNLYVKNLDIKGATYAGGIVGYQSTGNWLSYCYVDGCNISTTNETATASGAGAIAGRAGTLYFHYGVIRDTNVNAYRNAGGVVGSLDGNIQILYTYVAEDVNVSSKNNCAGGLVGYFQMRTTCTNQYNAVGATVTAQGNYVGGFFGEALAATQKTFTAFKVNNSYFVGTIKGEDYVGGFAGYLDNAVISGTTVSFCNPYNAITNCVFAGDIVANGEHVDLALNLRATRDNVPEVSGYTAVWDDNKYKNNSKGYFWEDSTLNGEIVRPEMSNTLQKTNLINSKFFRKDLKDVLSTGYNYTAHEACVTYMPFLNYTDASITFPTTNLQWEYDGKSVGILLPGYGGTTAVTTIYASDIDKLNIETSLDKIYVKIEGIEGSTSFGELDTSDGVATFKYDFMHNVTIGATTDGSGNIINGKTYTPSELRNTVMVDNADWYAIDESQNETGVIGGVLVNGYSKTDQTLPAEFQQLEYIEGTGTQYVNTGYSFTDKTQMTIAYEITEMPTSDYGAAIYGTARYYRRYFTQSAGYAWVGGSSRISNANIKVVAGVKYYEELKRGALNTTTQTAITTNERSPIHIFTSAEFENNGLEIAKMKLYSFQILENGEVVRNFIPVMLKSDGTVGLYEVFENRFYTSESEDGFIAGDIVVDSSSLITDGYYQVEFIQSNGTQFIDTGLGVEKARKYVLDFQFLETTNDKWILASDTSFEAGLYSNAFYKNAKFTYSQTDRLTRTVATGTNAVKTGNTTVCVFVRGSSKASAQTSLTSGAKARVFGLKIYEGDVLAYDLVPCFNAKDGLYGLYDLINSKFYGSGNADNFLGSNGTLYEIKQAESNIYADKALKVVHLWQGKALTNEGEIYSLINDGKKVTATYLDSAIASATMISDKPIYEKTYNMTENPEGNIGVNETVENWVNPFGGFVDEDQKYRRVEYILSKGEQYIDTGVVYALSKSYEITYEMTSHSSYQTIMGTNHVGTPMIRLFGSTSTSGTLGIQICGTVVSHAAIGNKVTQRYSKGVWSATSGENSFEVNVDATAGTPSSSAHVYIGGNSGEYRSNAKIYGAKIWDEEDNLIRDFIPVYNVETFECGLYDLVEQKYYKNARDTIPFAYSEEAVYDDRYIALSYIYAKGEQYIDTGYKPTNGLTAVKMYMSGTITSTTDNAIRTQVYFGVNGTDLKDIFYRRNNVHTNGTQYHYVAFNGSNTYKSANLSGTMTNMIDSHAGTWAANTLSATYTLKKATYAQSAYNLYLFALNDSGVAKNFCQDIKCYGCTITEWDQELNGYSVVRNYVPAWDSITGKAGLYDLIEKEFYPSNGKEDFTSATAGHINSPTIEKMIDSTYDVTVEMYKNFSRLSGTIEVNAIPVTISETLGYRLYVTQEVNGEKYYQYLISPLEDSVYDSVVYKVINNDEEITKYMATLTSDGTLHSSFKLNGVSINNIAEISNTMTAKDDNNYLVIKYKDGTLVVYDYVKGEAVYKQYKTFWSYAAHILNGFKSSVTSVFSNKNTIPTSSGTTLESSGLYRIAKNVAITSYLNTNSGNAVTMGAGVVTLNATGEGTGLTLGSKVYTSGKIYDLDGKILYSDDNIQTEGGTICLDDGKEYVESSLTIMIPKEIKSDIIKNIEGSEYDVIKFLVTKEEEEAQQNYIKNNTKVGKSSAVVNVYDPVIGERLDVDAGALIDNEEGSIAMLDSDYNPTDKPIKKSVFNVNYEFRHLFIDENKEGYLLIGIICVSIIAILVILGVSLQKRKKPNK